MCRAIDSRVVCGWLTGRLLEARLLQQAYGKHGRHAAQSQLRVLTRAVPWIPAAARPEATSAVSA